MPPQQVQQCGHQASVVLPENIIEVSINIEVIRNNQPVLSPGGVVCGDVIELHGQCQQPYGVTHQRLLLFKDPLVALSQQPGRLA